MVELLSSSKVTLLKESIITMPNRSMYEFSSSDIIKDQTWTEQGICVPLSRNVVNPKRGSVI